MKKTNALKLVNKEDKEIKSPYFHILSQEEKDEINKEKAYRKEKQEEADHDFTQEIAALIYKKLGKKSDVHYHPSQLRRSYLFLKVLTQIHYELLFHMRSFNCDINKFDEEIDFMMGLNKNYTNNFDSHEKDGFFDEHVYGQSRIKSKK